MRNAVGIKRGLFIEIKDERSICTLFELIRNRERTDLKITCALNSESSL